MDLLEEHSRKLELKRWNEHLKLLATFFNTVAAGSLAGAVIVPAVNAASGQPTSVHWTCIPAAVILHLCGQVAYRLLRSEE